MRLVLLLCAVLLAGLVALLQHFIIMTREPHTSSPPIGCDEYMAAEHPELADKPIARWHVVTRYGRVMLEPWRGGPKNENP